MSEYQFVHFLATDRPLDDQQLEFMRRQSTRATITRWDFSNEYHFGNFHGHAREMLQRGYDVHLHYANFGIRRLMIRLPAGLPYDRRTFKAFRVPDGLEWHRAETLARIRDEAQRATWPLADATRTWGQLQESAGRIRNERLRQEQVAQEVARRKRLATVAKDPRKTIANIEKLVKVRATANYEQAVRELVDLREALGDKRGPARARTVAERLRRDNPRFYRPTDRLPIATRLRWEADAALRPAFLGSQSAHGRRRRPRPGTLRPSPSRRRSATRRRPSAPLGRR